MKLAISPIDKLDCVVLFFVLNLHLILMFNLSFHGY